MAAGDIAFWAATSFLLGNLSAGLGATVYLTIILAVLLGAICSLERRFAAPALLLILGSGTCFGFFYYHLFFEMRTARTLLPEGKSAFLGTVITEPRLSDRSQNMLLRLGEPWRGTVSVVTEPFPLFEYGNLLALDGVVQKSVSVHEFPSVVFPKIERTGVNGGARIKDKLLAFKRIFLDRFRNVFPPDTAALLAGLTFGARSEMSLDLRERMVKSGTIHLVALSGYNIAILVDVIRRTLGAWLKRRATFIATCAIIGLFVVMVGGEASVVRAAIMGGLLLFAGEAGRRYDLRNAIALTAAGMAVLDPSIVRSDVGFQLSFLSILGIAFIGPIIRGWLRTDQRGGGFLGWRDNFATTFAAQFAVAPLLLAVFGGFSLFGIIANMLILEFVPMTMFFGFLLGGILSVAPLLAIPLIWIAQMLLAYIIGVIAVFSELPAISLPPFPQLAIVAAFYAALLAWIFFYGRREKTT